jgi:uncharacterized lipoprotein NlpE involved in copper resistance
MKELTSRAAWDKIRALIQSVIAMKKRALTVVAVVSFVFLALVGCSNPNVDTAKVRAALQSIAADQKVQLEMALSAIDAGKYKEALLPLRKVAYGAKLDKNQIQIVQDTIEKVRAKIAKGQ